MNFCKMSHFCRKVTAFVLLLLLFLSLLSPAVVHAEDHDSGGHQIGSGEDTDSPIDPILEDGDRTITLRFSYKQFYGSRENIDYNWTYKLTGKGKFVVRSYRFRHDSSKEKGFFSMCFRVFSDKPFTAELSTSGGRAGTFSSAQVFNHKGIYFISNGVMGGLSPEYQGEVLSEVWTGFANLKVVPSEEDIPSGEDIIDSGMLDLTGDSYLDDETKRKNAVYDSSLDLTRLSGKINNDLNTNNPRPTEDFDIDMQWDYKNGFDVKDSYIEFVFYGNVYSGSLNTSKTWTNVTLTGIDRKLKKHKIYFAELYEKAFEKTGIDGNQFLPEYIYVTCYGEIENTFCRSRVYKLNIRDDYGIPNIIEDPVPLPEEYFPDPDDPDPGPKDPTPDDGDYTDFDPTPIPDPVPTPDGGDILSYLRWLLDFLNGLSSSLGEFPVLVNEVFGFLPHPVIFLLGASIVVIVILRFLGR